MASCSLQMYSKAYIFDPRPRLPFQMAVKRYWVGELGPAADDQDAFSKTREDVRTLVFIHGGTCHKEHWEPTILRLLELERTNPGTSVRFRDMWALDLPNHGDSAMLNEEALHWGYDTFSWEDNARCVHAFLARLGTGVDVDFSKRRLSLVGHCMGGTTLILMTTYYPLLEILSLHLLEPYLLGEKSFEWAAHFVAVSLARDDIWPSTEAAYQALRKKERFLHWDNRIQRIFVTHGLRPLPTPEYPDKTEGVTLKCTKKQQAAFLRDFRSPGSAYRFLSHVVQEIETHIACGEIADAMPYDLLQDVLHVASGGISNFASTSMVSGAGHAMVETHPDVVADVVWKQLSVSHARSRIDNGTLWARL